MSDEDEKAAVKRSLAQEARFRDEKQQIVASMGGSPVELLTPSVDPRLQRKLKKNSTQSSSSAHEFQDSLLPSPLQEDETAPSGEIFSAVVVNGVYPVPLDHAAERGQYGGDEVLVLRDEPKKCNKTVYLLAGAAFLALALGSVIGVVAALLNDRPNTSSSPPSTSTPSEEDGASDAANEQCQLDPVALAQCANGILMVPVCAEAAYLELTSSTFSIDEEEACNYAYKGLVALAVAQTNYGDDELLDPVAFYAISTLYFALEGMNWRDARGWLKGSSPCSGSWSGVECSPNGLFNIMLDKNQLQGTIPTEIGLLSNLETFSITVNEGVSGSLPSEVGLLRKLKRLFTGLTRINSSLPSEIGNLEELRELDITSCPLTGTIPTEIGKLINLVSLHLDSNRFAGTIPEELGGLVNLESMVLRNLVGIAGPFPSNMFIRLSNLRRLSINLLHVDASSSFLQNLLSKAIHLTDIHIPNIALTGSFPTELGLLSDLLTILMTGTYIEGTIPSELGLLTKLLRVDLSSSSSLTGPLPSELGSLTNLDYLDITNTPQLSGTIPTEICALSPPSGIFSYRSGVINTCGGD